MIFKRPWPLIILMVLLLVFTVSQFVRFAEALALWSFLGSLPLSVPPLYLALTGLVWGVLGEVAIYLTWMGRPKARQIVRYLTLAYVIYYWLEQFLLMDDPLRKVSWKFSAGVSIFFVLFVLSILQQDSVRLFLGEPYEPKEQD